MAKRIRPSELSFGSFINSDSVHHQMRNNQTRAYANGAALRNHMAIAHKGEFDNNCSACYELKLKTDAAQLEGESED